MGRNTKSAGCFIPETFVWVLRKFFVIFGRSIGNYPWIYCTVTTLVCCLLCGGFLITELDNNVRDGYTGLDAPSRIEQVKFEEFFDNTPFVSYIQVRANDGGSMLRLQQLNATVELLDFIVNDFLVEYEGKKRAISSICYPDCEYENDAIRQFYSALDAKDGGRSQNESQNQIGDYSHLDYPISTIFRKEVNLADHFYGVELKDKNDLNDTDDSTTIEFVKLIVFRFSNMKVVDSDRDFLKKWDADIFEFSKTYVNPLINMSTMSQVAITKEVVRAGLATMPFFPIGFGMMLVFAVSSVLLSAWLNSSVGLKNGKPFVTIFGVVCPVMATGAALGFIFLIGYKANSVLSVVPFLVLAIGIDDAFLMIHAWQRSMHEKSIPERMGLILADVGPSVSVTSITNSVAFGIGALTPTPAIRLLCIANSVAMFTDLIFEFTFFGAILAISGRKEVPEEKSLKIDDSESSSKSSSTETPEHPSAPASPRLSLRSKVNSTVSSFLLKYSKFVSSWPAIIVVVLFFSAYWSVSILGVVKMKVDLSCLKLWLKDSPMLPAMVSKHNVMWYDYNYVLVMVNKPPDFTNLNQSLEFTELMEKFERLPNALGRESTRLWVTDYQQFLRLSSFSNTWGDYDYYDNSHESARKILGDFDPYLVADFLKIADYEHWNKTVHWEKKDGKIGLKNFAFVTAYKNCTTWAIRARLMTQWREIALQYPQFEVSVWEYDGFFADQILTLKGVTLKTVAITMCCMAAICFLFIPNLWCVIVASLSTASISFGVYGILSWWDMDLDPISMVSLIMSIGFSVDYTAHISYHFYQQCANIQSPSSGPLAPSQSRAHCMHVTLRSVGWPMIQAGVSTIIAVLPLSWVESYMADVFCKTVVLVSLCGLLHGLFIVPVVLANVPDGLHRFLTPEFCRGNLIQGCGGSAKSSETDEDSPKHLRTGSWFKKNRVVPVNIDLSFDVDKSGKTQS